MLIAIINIVTLSQIVFFTIFLLFKRSNRISNKLLISFLVAQGFVYINNLGFLFHDFVYANFPHLFFIGQAFMFLWSPLLYLYVCSLTKNNFRFNVKLLPHFIPFLAVFIFIFFAFYIHDADSKRHIMDTNNISLYFKIYQAFMNLQILIYMIFAMIRVHQFGIQLKYNFATLDKINLSWLRILLYCYMVAWLVTLVVYIMQWILINPPEFLMVLVFLFFLTFINIIVFKALTTPEIFYTIDLLTREKRKSLSEIKRQQYMIKLEKYVQEHKPYLSSTINLNELADMVDIPPRSLSEVINDSFNQTFFDFINSYRIEEAEELLFASKDPAITVSEVLYKVGYNSKSSFYSAFKKFKGYSPTQLKQAKKISSSS